MRWACITSGMLAIAAAKDAVTAVGDHQDAGGHTPHQQLGGAAVRCLATGQDEGARPALYKVLRGP
jgi:hypothetical protein